MPYGTCISIKVLFNVPNTPAFNIIETVFCDLKKVLRNKNKSTAKELVEEAIHFLRNNVTEEYIKTK